MSSFPQNILQNDWFRLITIICGFSFVPNLFGFIYNWIDKSNMNVGEIILNYLPATATYALIGLLIYHILKMRGRIKRLQGVVIALHVLDNERFTWKANNKTFSFRAGEDEERKQLRDKLEKSVEMDGFTKDEISEIVGSFYKEGRKFK